MSCFKRQNKQQIERKPSGVFESQQNYGSNSLNTAQADHNHPDELLEEFWIVQDHRPHPKLISRPVGLEVVLWVSAGLVLFLGLHLLFNQ